jgi:uncharacterized protein (TIGR03437 family)
MAVLKTRYEVRIGEPVEILAPRDTVNFLAHAKTRRVAIDDRETGLTVAPNQTQDAILLAPSSKAVPGEYTVTLSAASETGEQRQTALDVVVKPRVSVPNNSTRPPVVLLNGWQTGVTNSCPVATTSTTTFGNLAQYLVADGVPVVYLFDNCLEDANQPIETLGNDLGTFLNTIKYDDGTQVQQIDLIGYSMGGLIARAYLSGLQTSQTYTPPASTLVRKLVLIATPNFGSFVAGNYANTIPTGTQSAELVPASALLWNLATWNLRGDDLHGVDAIAIIGNAGTYTSGLSSSTVLTNASDGLVSLTSASLGFVSQKDAVTRIVPYCHVDPAAYTNPNWGTFNCNAPGIANVTSEAHNTSQIVRSFLAGTTAWSSIGTTPSTDQYLATNGAMFFAVQASNSSYVSDLSQVTYGSVQLQNGGDTGTIFYTDFVFGSGLFSATSASLGSINCGTLTMISGYTAAIRCKLGAAIVSVTPLASNTAGRVFTAGTTITINGAGFGGQCNGCQVLATPANTGTAVALAATSWGSQAISVKLPASVTGLVTLNVVAIAGSDTIGIFVVGSSSIAAAPSSLQFAYTTGGAVPAAQAIQITNAGSGTLAWTATASVPWLSLSAASGTAPSALSVTVPVTDMSAGTYNGTVQISAAGSANSPVSIPVTLTVTAAAVSLVVAPQTVTFQYTAGGDLPAAQDISVTNGGGGTLAWTAASGAFWAAPSAASGNAPATVSIAVNPANLAAGTYTTTVTIAAADGSVSPAPVSVTLVVQGTQAAGTISAVVNGGSFQAGIASGTWISIFGTNLSQRTYTWQAGDIVNGALPTTLQGVSVTINGVPAYVDYISPSQINVLAPDDATVGPVQVQVITAQQKSNAFTAQKAPFAPAFLILSGTSVAALHADYSLVGVPNLLQGVTTTPAKPGETILLYGVGFGPSNPAQNSGQVVAAAEPLANDVQIKIGGVAATVTFAGLVQSGLYQFNVTVPNVANGDAAVAATIGGVATQTGISLAVQQ